MTDLRPAPLLVWRGAAVAAAAAVPVAVGAAWS